MVEFGETIEKWDLSFSFPLVRKVNFHSDVHAYLLQASPCLLGYRGVAQARSLHRRMRSNFKLMEVCKAGAFQSQASDPFQCHWKLLSVCWVALPLWLQHILQVRFLYPSNVSLILSVRGRVCGGREGRRGGNTAPLRHC